MGLIAVMMRVDQTKATDAALALVRDGRGAFLLFGRERKVSLWLLQRGAPRSKHLLLISRPWKEQIKLASASQSQESL